MMVINNVVNSLKATQVMVPFGEQPNLGFMRFMKLFL